MHSLQDLAGQISSRLHTETFGRPLHTYDRVTSTNDIARDLADQGAAEGTAVLALEQTAGRGRLGRRWVSPRGGLYLSIVLRPEMPVDQWALLGIAVAVGAAEAAEAIAGPPITLKWPNDLLWENKKVGGVLIEAQTAFAVVGIGINAAVPSSLLHPESASLGVELIPLVCNVLQQSEQFVRKVQHHPSQVLTAWRSRSATLGRPVRIAGSEEMTGIAEDIDPHGALLLRTPNGLRRVLAGDVSLR